VRSPATKSRGSKVRVWLPGYLFSGGVKFFAHARKIVTNGNLGLCRSDGPNSPGQDRSPLSLWRKDLHYFTALAREGVSWAAGAARPM